MISLKLDQIALLVVAAEILKIATMGVYFFLCCSLKTFRLSLQILRALLDFNPYPRVTSYLA